MQWPEVTEGAEQARYETARVFLAAIEPSTKSNVDNRRLKDSYDISVKKALAETRESLKTIASLGPSDDQTLESVIRLCARTWLECCSQRYRLLVRMPDEVDDYLAPTTGREKYSLKVVVKPDIKRFGTSQGEDLAKGEVVTGWRGLVQSYPVR